MHRLSLVYGLFVSKKLFRLFFQIKLEQERKQEQIAFTAFLCWLFSSWKCFSCLARVKRTPMTLIFKVEWLFFSSHRLLTESMNERTNKRMRTRYLRFWNAIFITNTNTTFQPGEKLMNEKLCSLFIPVQIGTSRQHHINYIYFCWISFNSTHNISILNRHIVHSYSLALSWQYGCVEFVN